MSRNLGFPGDWVLRKIKQTNKYTKGSSFMSLKSGGGVLLQHRWWLLISPLPPTRLYTLVTQLEMQLPFYARSEMDDFGDTHCRSYGYCKWRIKWKRQEHSHAHSVN
jgi:hypothetical protein